jgi:hypothetical protein
MPRFVVLRHVLPATSVRGTHFDLMFEVEQSLATWACDRLPTEVPIEAVRLADHRLEYLAYEGPISGDRGSVERVDAGTFDLLEVSSIQWRLQVEGRLLCGEMTLRWIEGDRWQMTVAARA